MAQVTHTTVMLVDDHEIMRDGLREVLQRSGDFQVVGEAGDGVAAVRMAQQLKPDVVIMDVVMPRKNGIEACRDVTEALPNTSVLIRTPHRKRMPQLRRSPQVRRDTFRNTLARVICCAASAPLLSGNITYPPT